MGGKNKQHQQRVKNNARPSSSGRSAELLNMNTNPFAGFSANLDQENLVTAGASATPTAENIDGNVDSEFLLVMKKMLKKDPTTKVKAIKKFSDWIQEIDEDTIKTILSVWAKGYQNLSIDIDHRVREATQLAHKEIVEKIKKEIAPILKQILPVWLLSQYDVYAPAASISKSSFNLAFPSTKINSVLIFAQTEIIEFLNKNLLWHTASTLSNLKVVSSEEAETKYRRLIKASIKTFSYFLENTHSDQNLNKEKILEIIQSDKFSALAKSKVVKIRCAWFGMLLVLLQHTPELLEPRKKQILQTCFQNMDESDPRCLTNVWDCILISQVTFTDWQELIDIKKIVIPKLFSLLKNNIFNGTISSIGPSLLPFISNLNEKSVANVNFDLYDFYNNFFQILKENILKTNEKSVDITTASKSDLLNLVIAYFECFRYVIKNIDDEINANNLKHSIFAIEFLNKYLIDLIKWSLNINNIILKYINLHMSTLIAYWKQNQKQSKLYNDILNEFWLELWSILCSKFSNQQEQIDTIAINNLVNLIHALNYAMPTIKSNRVKFNDSKSNDSNKGSETSLAARKTSTENLQNDLKILVIKFMKFHSLTKNLKNYIIPFKRICKMFGDKEFYTKISVNENIKSTLDNLIELLNQGEFIEEILDIIFEINLFCEKDQLPKTIKIILKIKDETLQSFVLNKILSHPLCMESEIQKILQNNVSEIICQIANNIVNGKTPVNTQNIYLLKKCFHQIDNDTILINKMDVEKMIKIMCLPLESPENYGEVLDTCGSFIGQMFPVICSKQNSTEKFCVEVFNILFKFSINTQENDCLSADTLWEITTAWQDALLNKDIIMTDEILLNCCKITFQYIENKIDDLNIPELIKISDIITKLFLTSTENIESDTERYDKIDEMIEKFFTTNNIYNNRFNFIENLCLYFEIINKSVNTTEIYLDANDMSANMLNTFLTIEFIKFNTIKELTINDERTFGNKIEFSDDNERSFDDNDNIEENCKIIKVWSKYIINCYVRSIKIAAIGESLIKYSNIIQNDMQISIFLELSEHIKTILQNESRIKEINKIQENILENSSNNDMSIIRIIEYLISTKYYADYEENKFIVLFENISEKLLNENSYLSYSNFVRYNLDTLKPRSLNITDDMFNQCDNLVKASLYLSLIKNHSDINLMKLDDRKIIGKCIKFLTEIGELQQTKRELFIYNDDISNYDTNTFNFVIEFINLLTECTERFPTEFNIKNWDSIRIGLSSWVLTVSRNRDNYNQPKVSIFISAVYGLFKALIKFINIEKTKSSTTFLCEIIDEWENLFAKEVNLILFKTFYHLVSVKDYNSIYFVSLLNTISQCIEYFDFKLIYNSCKNGMKITNDDLIQFSLENLQNINSIKISCMFILNNITPYLIQEDIEILETKTDQMQNDNNIDWNFLSKFSAHGNQYYDFIKNYNDDFSYKVTEIDDFKNIIAEDAFTYLYYWDVIIQVLAKSSAEIRSIYASWVAENGFEHLLNFLFRAMPVEVLKNFDVLPVNTDAFKPISWNQIKDETITVEYYACHLYTETLRHLPAMIRKWWSSLNTRQKLFVDKLTTNYASSLIWQEDLKQIALHDKIHENMQIQVHQSTREVVANYAIDEAKMDLTITLAQNYPLGGVKVDTGKQIGGRTSSRNVGMQLTVFLMHQNGSIFDGLSLWKENLDKKFAGVEECYVCYTVIHHDTCQLPKLTCKTCKKKFHGPCLYKWFTTSSKSTCPLCRNIF